MAARLETFFYVTKIVHRNVSLKHLSQGLKHAVAESVLILDRQRLV